jgi:hypothetical protein
LVDVTFQATTPATPPSGTVVETIAGVAGANRQVVDVSSVSGALGLAAPSGSLPVVAAKLTTSTVTNTAYSASSVTITGGVSNVGGMTIANYANGTLYALLGGNGTASTTNFTVPIPPGGYYEVPDNYYGPIYGIWASATSSGGCNVTQFTP